MVGQGSKRKDPGPSLPPLRSPPEQWAQGGSKFRNDRPVRCGANGSGTSSYCFSGCYFGAQLWYSLCLPVTFVTELSQDFLLIEFLWLI